MSTIMNYAVSTDPFPLQASPKTGNLTTAGLTMVVSNPTDNLLKLEGLVLTIPIGDAASELTHDNKGIVPVPASDWKLSDTVLKPGFVKYIFQPDAGHGNVGGQGLVFRLNKIAVNRQPGTFKVKIIEGSHGCDPPSNCPWEKISLTKFPNGWGKVSFWVNPTEIANGGTTKLNWSGPSGATFKIEYYTIESGIVNIPAQGEPALPNTGEHPVTLDETTVFTLDVSQVIEGVHYFAQDQKTVTVEIPAPEITAFEVTPKFLFLKSNTEPVQLSWTAKNVSKVVVDNRVFEGADALKGSKTVPAKRQYLLTAYGMSGYSGSPATNSVSLTAWLQEKTVSLANFAYNLAVNPETGEIYVLHNSSHAVSIISADLNNVQVVQVANNPQGITVSADGSLVYVVCGQGWDTSFQLSIIQAGSKSVELAFDVGPEQAWGVVADPKSGSSVCYASGMGICAYKIDAATKKVTQYQLPSGYLGTRGVAISGDGVTLYVLCNNSKVVLALEAATGKVIKAIGTSGSGWNIALIPGTERLFVNNGTDSTVDVLDFAQGIRVATVGVSPFSQSMLASSPDGKYVYVVSSGKTNLLTIMDGTTHAKITEFDLSHFPHYPQGVALSADGNRLFVTTNKELLTFSRIQ